MFKEFTFTFTQTDKDGLSLKMKIWLLNDTSRVEHLIGFKLSQMCQYVKCVKSEALAMIKGWSYLSKGAILVASSTCGKNTNIKRNAKAKASVTFKRLIKQRFNTSK